MKNSILFLFVIIPMMAVSQIKYGVQDPADYVYISGRLDLNNTFGIVDNPRTENEILGFHTDIEIGARDRHVGVHLDYGFFFEQDYQYYGLGVDYYIEALRDRELNVFGVQILDGTEFSFGVGYGVVLRKIQQQEKQVWGGSTGYNLRGQTILWITEDFGVPLVLKFQQRGDIPKYGIFEGSLGVIFKFNR